MQLKRLTLATSVVLAMPAFASAQVVAVATGESVPAHDFEQITVTATRTEQAIKNVPATVNVIDRERMDQTLVRDLKDLFRYMPGVSVTSGFGRFGIGDIRIRGLDGNRVRIETDGIAISDAFAIGSYSDANRNFVDMDTLKRAEVVRGPASALYGSDALGGVVSFVTKDPADYLAPGKGAYLGFKLGYQSDWQGLSAGSTAAFGGERWSGMAVVTHRQGRETDNQGDNRSRDATRTAANSQSRDGRSLLSKLVYTPSLDQQVTLTVEGNEDRAETDVMHLRGFQPFTGATTLLLTGDDLQTRARVSLEHELSGLDGSLADSLTWRAYRQDSETTQDTIEERIARGQPQRREREFNFDQRVYGLELEAHKAFATGSAEHLLTWGVEVSRTDLAQKRDGRVIDLLTGESSNVVMPDVFPVRDFPRSRIDNAALFVQDEITLADGKLTLLPGLRVDYYALEPQDDPIFAEDNPTMQAVEVTESNVSPKLGAVWHFSDDWSTYASYARGFRSPPYNDVNLGFTNLQFGYAAIPNPDLRPETSDGAELGLRHSGRVAYFGLAGFYNRYDDFIESAAMVSRPPETPLVIFQSRNVAEAEIYGVELQGGVELEGWSPALQGWSLRGAASWQRGQDLTADQPLNSVDPARASIGLAYEAQDWGVSLHGRFAAGKERLASPEDFAPPGYGVADLLAHWDFAPGAKINAGVFNLTDRKYWDWADVPGVAADSTVIDRYTRTGRNMGVSLAVSW
ncbi:MAG: TonB-dependent hemoglobin/transferrin/lactoferrin family receptor [Lysobacter sp.]